MERMIELDNLSGLDSIIEKSKSRKQIIFKHSTRCSISSMVLDRFSRNMEALQREFDINMLDLIAHRDISSAIEERFGVRHESPQVLVIENGSCVYDNSHMGINAQTLLQLA